MEVSGSVKHEIQILIYVIGSGPAGIAAAYALKNRHAQVCILDVGHELEPERATVKSELSHTLPGNWSPESLEFVKSHSTLGKKEIPRKLLFGSEFPYREPPAAAPCVTENARVTRSFARGGLSSVWGACVLPYPDRELGAWPQAARDLERHYRAVCDFMPVTGEDDDLSAEFPLHAGEPGAPENSTQTQALLRDLGRKREALLSRGIRYGAARVAYENTNGNCKRCGMCLHGCPYDLIYSSAMTLPILKAAGVGYRSDVFVRRIQETTDSCRLYTISTTTGKTEVLDAERVFVGAGIWGTAELMLRSLEIFDTEIELKHSDRFMLPLMRWRGGPDPGSESHNTLCQLFIEMSDPGSGGNRMHLQVYAYNDMLRSYINRTFVGPEWARRGLLSRLLIAYGYIDSESSSGLHVKLTSDKRGELIIRGSNSKISRHLASTAARRIMRHMFAFRAIPGWPIMDPPGGGNHSGGSFPMSNQPSGVQTDIWGRINGWSRTHIVDASVFPSLPAGTIAFPAMANAHRIASGCPL